MPRYEGVLKAEYLKKLEDMTLSEIAADAAHFRSSCKRKGTATALILRWVFSNRVYHSSDAKHFFLRLYNAAWEKEKAARAKGLATRPIDRPAVGHRMSSRSRDRIRSEMGFARL